MGSGATGTSRPFPWSNGRRQGGRILSRGVSEKLGFSGIGNRGCTFSRSSWGHVYGEMVGCGGGGLGTTKEYPLLSYATHFWDVGSACELYPAHGTIF